MNENREEEIYTAGEEQSFKSDVNLMIIDDEEGYSDCGGPFVGQRLSLDFTYDENIDNEEVQAKCCEFWDFVYSQPELLLQPNTSFFSDDCYMESANYSISNKSIVKEKTAVSMLDLIDEKGLINCAFESKLPTESCKGDSNEYINKTSITDTIKSRFKISNGNKKNKKRSQNSAAGTLYSTCQKLHKWDLEHPNCKGNCKGRSSHLRSETKETSPDFRLNISRKYTCTPLPKSKQMINQGKRIISLNSHMGGINQTTYLKYADLAKRLGAWDAVKAKCASCNCGTCCACHANDYTFNYDLFNKIYRDMKAFDASVKEDCKIMRIMYDIE